MDRLRPLWDFDDLDLSERRFTEQLEREADDAGRAEVLTQLARVEGLRDAFERCGDLLDEAERVGGGEPSWTCAWPSSAAGCCVRAATRPAAYPLFVSAFERGTAAGEYYLAATRRTWRRSQRRTTRAFAPGRRAGSSSASGKPAAAYWRGPLLNNLGWTLHERGRERRGAGGVRARPCGSRGRPVGRVRVEIARYAVAVALRAVGRASEAADQSERAVAWSLRSGRDAPYFHEELAEDYAALGRVEAAAEHARRALELFGSDATPAQRARLEELAGGSGSSGGAG